MFLTGLARLGRDAEVRYLDDGTPVVQLALATNFGKKDPQTGNRKTQWVDASWFGENGKKLAQYLVKGQQVDVVMEEPHVEQFQKSDKTVGAALRARVLRLELAGKAPERPAGQQGQGSAPQQPAGQPAQQRTTSSNLPPADFGGFDDDIPF